MLLGLGILVFGRQRSIYIWLAFIAIWLYALLTGMRPPVIRAAIMGSLFLVAEYLGRQRSAIIALAFAAAVMVGIRPQILWSVSFQLSFLAMAGLVFLYPYFRTWGRRVVASLFGDRRATVSAGTMVVDGFAVTLAAIVAVWPLIAYNFGVVSLVSLPATFFSLPALPAIIVSSALVAFAGLVAPFVAQIFGWLAWLFLSYLLLVVQGFDALPFSSFQVSTVSAWQIWVYYGVVAGVTVSLGRRKQLAGSLSRLASGVKRMAGGITKPRWQFHKKWLIPPLVIIAILMWSVVLTLPDDKLHVSFLDVGQGDAILIQTPNRQKILIDGGPDPQKISLALSEKLPFWDRTIDLMVSTQPQADHITGLVEVLHRYKVKQVLAPGVPYESSIYEQWLEFIEERQIKHDIARAGQEIDLGDGIKIEVFNPPSVLFEGTSHDVDNNGIVLRLSWGEVSFLFTADIGVEAEFDLIGQRANLGSTVLKVAHHGSRTSTSPPFLAAVDPEIAVISVGADNPFGHPSPEVVERLIDRLGEDKLYRTSEDGTIEFITDGETLWVR
jgi:competence protein ComEC